MAYALISGTNQAFSLGLHGGTTGAIDMSGADLIVVVLGFTGAFGTYTTGDVTDNRSNSYIVSAKTTSTDGSTELGCQLAYAPATSVGSGHTISVANIGGSAFLSVCVAGFSGSLATSPLDAVNGAGGASVSSLQPGSVTPSEANELIITGLGANDMTGLGISPGTVAASISTVGGTSYGSGLGYHIQTTATAENPTWSWTNAYNCAARVATFKAAGGSGGTVFALIG